MYKTMEIDERIKRSVFDNKSILYQARELRRNLFYKMYNRDSSFVYDWDIKDKDNLEYSFYGKHIFMDDIRCILMAERFDLLKPWKK